MRSPSKKKYKLSYFVMFTVFLTIMCFIMIDSHIRPILYNVASHEGKVIATEVITTSVINALNSENVTYDKLVNVSKNNDGTVASIETNMAEINKLQSVITYNINHDFKDISKKNVILNTGTLSGINFFYGRGPEITFRLEQAGYVETRLVSKFTSAGVNQTLHQIRLEVKGNVAVIIPGFPTNVDVELSYLIAETVIVGKIPDSYVYITGDDRGDLQKIIDSQKLSS